MRDPERLTARDGAGNAYFPHCFEDPCGGVGCAQEDCSFLTEVCDRLAAYEETGLSPAYVQQRTEDVDFLMKVNLRLLAKFGDALRAEYGEPVGDTYRVFNTLYREQSELMPLPWYEYGFIRKEDENE